MTNVTVNLDVFWVYFCLCAFGFSFLTRFPSLSQTHTHSVSRVWIGPDCPNPMQLNLCCVYHQEATEPPHHFIFDNTRLKKKHGFMSSVFYFKIFTCERQV